MNKRAETIGDGQAIEFSIVHNFGTRDVVVAVYDANTGEAVMCGERRPDDMQVIIAFGDPPSAEQYRAVVIG